MVDDVYLVVRDIFVYFWWSKFSSIYIGLRLIGWYNYHWTYHYTFHTVFGAHFGAYQMKYDIIIPKSEKFHDEHVWFFPNVSFCLCR